VVRGAGLVVAGFFVFSAARSMPVRPSRVTNGASGGTSIYSLTDVPAAKHFREGTHRGTTPDVTVENLRRASQALGVTRLANVTWLDSIGLPVVTAIRPNARSISVAMGKGVSLDAARASALMEAAKLSHAEEIHRPVLFLSYDDLSERADVVDPDTLPRTATSQFHGGLRILWIEGFDIASQQPVWVPFELVGADYSLPAPPGSGCFHATSNGLGAGNNALEAVVHAACELIERDARTLWYLTGGPDRTEERVGLDSVDDEICTSLLARYREQGFFVAIWDITSDLGIPCFLVGLRETPEAARASGRWFVGSGVHLCREIALCRALTEAAQSRLTVISGARDGLPSALYQMDGAPLASQWNEDAILSAEPSRSFAQATSHPSDSLMEDLLRLQQLLASAGLNQILVVDLTRQDIGIPVVRVIVPGLESMHSAPGYTMGQRGGDALRRTLCL